MRQLILAFSFALLSVGFAADESGDGKDAKTMNDTELLASYVRHGKVTWLQSDGKKVLSIFHPADNGDLKGALILLPDLGTPPQAPDLVEPLQQQLPHLNWATLTLSVPPYLPPSNAKTQETPAKDSATPNQQPEASNPGPQLIARLNAAAEFLKQAKYQSLVVLALGSSANIMLNELAKQPNEQIDGVILLSAYSGEQNTSNTKPDNPVKHLSKITVPILEIFAEYDKPNVRKSAKRHKHFAKQNKEVRYQQRKLVAAYPYYRGQIDTLAKQIRYWLHREIPINDSQLSEFK